MLRANLHDFLSLSVAGAFWAFDFRRESPEAPGSEGQGPEVRTQTKGSEGDTKTILSPTDPFVSADTV